MLPVYLEVVYLIMGTCFFTIWLEFFKQDASLTVEERPQSMVTLVVATIFWPLVVPIAYLELILKKM